MRKNLIAKLSLCHVDHRTVVSLPSYLLKIRILQPLNVYQFEKNKREPQLLLRIRMILSDRLWIQYLMLYLFSVLEYCRLCQLYLIVPNFLLQQITSISALYTNNSINSSIYEWFCRIVIGQVDHPGNFSSNEEPVKLYHAGKLFTLRGGLLAFAQV